MKRLLIGLVCMGVAYAGYPYLAMYELAQAVKTQDTATLEEKVDWSSIRQGLKDDLSAALAMSMQTQQTPDNNAGFQMLGTMIGAKFADIMIDQMVTPAAFTMMLRRQVAAHPGTPIDPLQSVTWAFFDSPLKFLITVENDRREPVGLRMSMEDFTWKVSRLVFSPQQIADLAASMRGRSN